MAASIAAVALGLYALTLRQRIDVLQDRLREATTAPRISRRQAQVAHAVADQAREASAVLAASDVRRIDLAGQAPAPRAAGRALLELLARTLGLHRRQPPVPASGASVPVVGRAARPGCRERRNADARSGRRA